MPAADYELLARFYDGLVTDTSDIPFFLDRSQEASGPVLELMAGSEHTGCWCGTRCRARCVTFSN